MFVMRCGKKEHLRKEGRGGEEGPSTRVSEEENLRHIG